MPNLGLLMSCTALKEKHCICKHENILGTYLLVYGQEHTFTSSTCHMDEVYIRHIRSNYHLHHAVSSTRHNNALAARHETTV